jgi:hypothetical protein
MLKRCPDTVSFPLTNLLHKTSKFKTCVNLFFPPKSEVVHFFVKSTKRCAHCAKPKIVDLPKLDNS